MLEVSPYFSVTRVIHHEGTIGTQLVRMCKHRNFVAS